MPSLFRSIGFRLAALYALIFIVSVAAFATAAYFAISATMEDKIRARVRAETSDLIQAFEQSGQARLIELVKARERGLNGGFDYALYDAERRNIYGAIPQQGEAAGWAEFRRAPDGDEAPGELERFVVLTTLLANGNWLLVGDDLNPVDDLGRVVRGGLEIAVFVIFVLSVLGGVVLSWGFLRRIDTITRTAEAIIGGNVQSRVPLTGSGDDLDRLSVTLNHMLDRIASLIGTLRQVTNDIAHDLRTPLGRLRQGLDEARHRSLSPADYQAAMDRAIDETDSILGTFTALLRIAQLEAGTLHQSFRPVDLGAAAEAVTQAFAPSVEESGRRLTLQVQPGAVVDGDRELLTQLLANLVENEIQHTPPGTAIAVTVTRANGQVVLSVADDGPGVPEAERQRIFDRFYRLERSRGTPGNGLGLSIVAAIAELHRGRIEVADNAPGLRLSLALPEHYKKV